MYLYTFVSAGLAQWSTKETSHLFPIRSLPLKTNITKFRAEQRHTVMLSKRKLEAPQTDNQATNPKAECVAGAQVEEKAKQDVKRRKMQQINEDEELKLKQKKTKTGIQ